MLDKKLTRSTNFHQQIDMQIEVVSQMIVHLPRMYNSKHPRAYDKSLPYVHHRYNKTPHNSIGHNPFKVCFRFQPMAPIDVDLPLGSAQESPHV